MLEEHYKFPYWILERHSGLAVAIDEDGEIWILGGFSKTKYNKFNDVEAMDGE